MRLRWSWVYSCVCNGFGLEMSFGNVERLLKVGAVASAPMHSVRKKIDQVGHKIVVVALFECLLAAESSFTNR
jgi:hypothetical protein